MKKPVVIYLLVFFLSFIITNTLLYFMMNKQYQKSLLEDVVTDSIPDLTSLVQPDTLIDKIEEVIPNRIAEYEKFMALKKEMTDMMQDLAIYEYTQPQIDSVKNNANIKIDSLAMNNQQQIANMSMMSDKIDSLTEQNSELLSRIKTLTEKISEMEKEKSKEEVVPEDNTQQEQSLKYLAQTYDTMKPKEVARLLLPLPDEKVIKILKMMNQRKTGKVLQSLPAIRSSRIINKMTM